MVGGAGRGSAGQRGRGIEHAEAEESLRGGAAQVRAVGVVRAAIVQLLDAELVGAKVDQRREDEGFLDAAGIQALEDRLGTLAGL